MKKLRDREKLIVKLRLFLQDKQDLIPGPTDEEAEALVEEEFRQMQESRENIEPDQ